MLLDLSRSCMLIQSSTFHSSPDQDLSRPTTSFDLTATDIKSHKLFFSALLLRSYHLDQHTKKWRYKYNTPSRLSHFFLFLGFGLPLYLPPALHLLELAPRTWTWPWPWPRRQICVSTPALLSSMVIGQIPVATTTSCHSINNTNTSMEGIIIFG